MIKTIHVLLADDDKDDRFFFDLALKDQTIKSFLTTVEDGEQLMSFLSKNYRTLPDVLFLDLNMPRKNGAECLEEIILNKKLKNLPVIIYSTSLPDDIADHLYNTGACYYIRKTDMIELQKILRHVLTMFSKSTFVRPTRRKFILKLG